MSDEPDNPTSDEVWTTTEPIPAPPPGDPHGIRSDPQRQRRLAIVVGGVAFTVLLLVGLVLTLVVGGDDPESISAVSTSTSVAVVPSTVAPSTTTIASVTTVGGPTTSTVAPTTTLPSAIPLDRSITVAGNGLYDLTVNSNTTVNSESWAVAFRLPGGDFVGQHVFPGYGEPGDNTVYRVGATTTVLIAPANDDTEWVRLHDVFREGGSTFALVSVKSGMGFEEAREELFTVDVDTGGRTSLGIIGGWEEGPSRLSYGAGFIAGEYFSEIGTGPYFLSLDGVTVNPNDFGLAEEYEWCDVCPGNFATDPSGTRIAWVEGDLMVVFDRNTGNRIAEARLPAGIGVDVDSLELLGNTVIVNVYDRTTGVIGSAYVVGFDGTSTRLSVPGRATFDL